MYKILLKKQFSELFSRMMNRSIGGIRHTKIKIFVFAALAAYILGLMGYLFYSMADMMCAPLYRAGLSWLYFALMGLLTALLGLVGSVFIAYSALYQAKDNELLLSMPISPGAILFSRMAMVYLMSVLFEMIAWIPVTIQYFRAAGWSFIVLAANLIILVVLPFLALVLSCILGWVIALLSAHVRSNVAVTVILTLGFIGAYYYFYRKASEYLNMILLNSRAVSARIRVILYPFYHLGRGAAGDARSLLIFTGMILAVFAVVYAVLAKSFLRMLTTKRGAAKTVYRERTLRAAKPESALLRKEFMRLTGSSVYMLNCGMGAVLLLIGAGAAVVKGRWLNEMFRLLYPGLGKAMPLFLCAAVAAVSSMNDLTAPSISLEGKNFWLVKSLPVSAGQVLKAKLKLQLLVSGIPTVICAAVLNVVTGQSVISCILAPVCCLLFVIVCAAFGLLVNLKLPNFTWTNEMVAVKQSMSVAIAILTPWCVIAALGFLYYVVWDSVNAEIYLAVSAVLLGVLAAVLLWVLKEKGTRMFEKL